MLLNLFFSYCIVVFTRFSDNFSQQKNQQVFPEISSHSQSVTAA